MKRRTFFIIVYAYPFYVVREGEVVLVCGLSCEDYALCQDCLNENTNMIGL